MATCMHSLASYVNVVITEVIQGGKAVELRVDKIGVLGESDDVLGRRLGVVNVRRERVGI